MAARSIFKKSHFYFKCISLQMFWKEFNKDFYNIVNSDEWIINGKDSDTIYNKFEIELKA